MIVLLIAEYGINGTKGKWNSRKGIEVLGLKKFTGLFICLF